MWTYSQDDGRLYDPDGVHVGTGYSGGNEGDNPEGINNYSMQRIKSIGPIPCGVYRKGPVVLSSHLGPFAIPLLPDANNEMWGRGDFYMHGDTNPSGKASKGCIIQARSVRNEFYASDDEKLTVVQHYDPA